jgi:hypothetical protein
LFNDASQIAANHLIENLALVLSGGSHVIWGPHWLIPFRPYIALLLLLLAIYVGMIALSERKRNWLFSISIVLFLVWAWLQFLAGWWFSIREWIISLLTPDMGWAVRTVILFAQPLIPLLFYSYVNGRLEYSVSPRLRTILSIVFGGLIVVGVLSSLYLLIFQGWWRFLLRALLTGG